MSWHCEDAALPFSALPAVRARWHEIARRYVDEYEIFDDWGMFAYTNGAHKPWGDVLAEIRALVEGGVLEVTSAFVQVCRHRSVTGQVRVHAGQGDGTPVVVGGVPELA